MVKTKKETPATPHLAICSCPIQPWGELYPLDRALKEGTIFPDLNKPFFGGKKNEK